MSTPAVSREARSSPDGAEARLVAVPAAATTQRESRGVAADGRKERLANAATALVLVVALPPLTAGFMPRLVEPHQWLAFDQALALVVAALSLNLLFGYAGQISLGHAGFVGLGAFVTGNLVTRLPLPFPFALAGGALAASAVAAVVGVPSLRLRGLYLAAVTLLFGIAMQYAVFPARVLSSGSSGVAVPIRLIGDHDLTNDAWLATICLVVLVLVWVLDGNLLSSKLGRALRAVRDDEEAAQALGVDVTRYKLVAFVLSGALAGLAGGLDGMAVGHVDSNMFSLFSWSLPLLIVVIVGGAGHRLAVVISALVYGLLPEFFGGLSAVRPWIPVIGASLLLLTVSRHPGGLAELVRHTRRPGASAAPGTEPVVSSFAAVAAQGAVRADPGLEHRTAARNAALLEVRDVRVRFGGLVAVDGVSLSVPRASIVGLIGPNGAGKSTLFGAIAGSVPVENGSVRFGGAEVGHLRADQRARLGIARSFQQVGLARGMSVRDNLLLAQHRHAGYGELAALLTLPRVARREELLRKRADEALEALGLADRAGARLAELSGGQQRIVEIACLLLSDPELLLLDEPSAGMAPGVVEHLAERLTELRDVLGQTIVVIEHNLPLVTGVCDYLYALDAGRVVAEGRPAEVVADPRVIEAYLGRLP